jgi:hypothetical protein
MTRTLAVSADSFAERKTGRDNPVDTLSQGDLFCPAATYMHRQINLLESLVIPYGKSQPDEQILEWVLENNTNPIAELRIIAAGMKTADNPLTALIERLETILKPRK